MLWKLGKRLTSGGPSNPRIGLAIYGMRWYREKTKQSKTPKEKQPQNSSSLNIFICQENRKNFTPVNL